MRQVGAQQLIGRCTPTPGQCSHHTLYPSSRILLGVTAGRRLPPLGFVRDCRNMWPSHKLPAQAFLPPHINTHNSLRPRADHSQRHISAPARDALHDRHPGLHKPDGVGARGMVRKGLVQEWRHDVGGGLRGRGGGVGDSIEALCTFTKLCALLCVFVLQGR